MSRIETISFECDWCHTIKSTKRGVYPDGWREWDGDLCRECHDAKAKAIESACEERQKLSGVVLDELGFRK